MSVRDTGSLPRTIGETTEPISLLQPGVTMRAIRQYRATLSLVFVTAALALTACSSGSDKNLIPSVPTPSASAKATFDLTSGTTCFAELTDEQHTALTDYAQEHPTAGSDSSDTVCILRDSETGGTAQHYYIANNGLDDFELYLRLHRLAQQLAVHGLITGELDTAHTYSLELLRGVTTDGAVFRPYQLTDQGWGRLPMIIGNQRITEVYYGDTDPVPFKDAAAKRPSSYTLTPLPADKDTVVEVVGTTVTVLDGLPASAILRDAKVIEATSVELTTPVRPTSSPHLHAPSPTPTDAVPASPTPSPTWSYTPAPSPMPVPPDAEPLEESPDPTQEPSSEDTGSDDTSDTDDTSDDTEDSPRSEEPSDQDTSDSSDSEPSDSDSSDSRSSDSGSSDDEADSDNPDASEDSGPKGKAHGHDKDKPGKGNKGGNSDKK